MAKVSVDTGPIVALFDRNSGDRAWAMEHFERLSEPLVTCEAVLAEAIFLMRRDGLNPEVLIDTVRRGLIISDFNLYAEISPICTFFQRYSDQRISLADACLVRMSEIFQQSVVFTLDRDFLVYRRNGRQKIPLIAPFA